MPIRLFFCALALLVGTGLCSSAFAQDLSGQLKLGRSLTSEAVAALEKELAENPKDLFARARLVGYYCRQYGNRSALARHSEHVIWFIKNAPESNLLNSYESTIRPTFNVDAYVEGRDEWSWHLEHDPNNLKVLRHAARFSTFSDRGTAIQLLERAQSLDESNPDWARALAQLHRSDSRLPNGKRDAEAAKRSLAQYELAYELSDELRRGSLLRYICTAAFDAGEIEKARGYADALLQGTGANLIHGENVHYGNLMLGRLALLEDDIEEAKSRLIAAGEPPESPLLRTMGPDMTLASELLERGESEVVLRYLSLCLEFWKSGQGKVVAWTAMIEKGFTPKFTTSISF